MASVKNRFNITSKLITLVVPNRYIMANIMLHLNIDDNIESINALFNYYKQHFQVEVYTQINRQMLENINISPKSFNYLAKCIEPMMTCRYQFARVTFLTQDICRVIQRYV